jgi:hypothetical protein
MRTTALLAALVLCIAPAIARADETLDKTRCDAATQAQDWTRAATYCRALADDYASDAQTQTGRQRGLDLALEGVAMAAVAVAYDNIENYGHAASAKTAARFFLTDAQTQTDDPKVLNFILTALSRLSP